MLRFSALVKLFVYQRNISGPFYAFGLKNCVAYVCKVFAMLLHWSHVTKWFRGTGRGGFPIVQKPGVVDHLLKTLKFWRAMTRRVIEHTHVY